MEKLKAIPKEETSMETDHSNQKPGKQEAVFQVAELPEACCEKITEFERELNAMGYWNISLVAYQKEQ